MQIKTIKTIYSRPPTLASNESPKNCQDTVSVFSEEVQYFDEEKKKVEQKIISVEKKIWEVQNEIDAINNTIKETKEYIEKKEASQKVKHVTLEY